MFNLNKTLDEILAAKLKAVEIAGSGKHLMKQADESDQQALARLGPQFRIVLPTLHARESAVSSKSGVTTVDVIVAVHGTHEILDCRLPSNPNLANGLIKRQSNVVMGGYHLAVQFKTESQGGEDVVKAYAEWANRVKECLALFEGPVQEANHRIDAAILEQLARIAPSQPKPDKLKANVDELLKKLASGK